MNATATMKPKKGRIVCRVVFTAGDGPEVVIPLGPCEIAATSQDVTISWEEEGKRGVAAIPFDLYATYLSEGTIALEQ